MLQPAEISKEIYLLKFRTKSLSHEIVLITYTQKKWITRKKRMK